MIKTDHIFFDLDDTLINSSAIYEKCYKSLGIDQDPKFVIAKRMIKETIQPGHTSAHNRIMYFKKFIEIKYGTPSPSAVLKLNSLYERKLTQYVSEDLNQTNIKSILKKLARKYTLSIITNETCRTQLLKINQIDPKGKIFSSIITSEELGVEKPNFKIFKEALRIAMVNPKNIAMIGDSIENDIQPALKLGMKAIITQQFVKTKAPKNTPTITNLNQLLELLG